MPEYKVVENHYPKEFEEEVNLYLAKGWMFVGSLCVAFDAHGKPRRYLQALYKG